MKTKEFENKALKKLSLERNMGIEELKKYREYSSRELTGQEWIEYLKLCEKTFKDTTKYVYLYEHEIKKINKYIDELQQENNQLKLINKEHQQINGQLREANKLLNEQYIRLYKEYEQQERIKYLERSNNRREDTILEQRQKICDLEDNWNKLKEIVKSQSGFKKQADLKGGLWFEIDELLDKMQELEQGSDSK